MFALGEDKLHFEKDVHILRLNYFWDNLSGKYTFYNTIWTKNKGNTILRIVYLVIRADPKFFVVTKTTAAITLQKSSGVLHDGGKKCFVNDKGKLTRQPFCCRQLFCATLAPRTPKLPYLPRTDRFLILQVMRKYRCSLLFFSEAIYYLLSCASWIIIFVRSVICLT